MRFNTVLLAIFVLQGCGLLGPKDDQKKIIEYKSSAEGCLNDFGPNMEKFIDGEVSVSSWNETWECTVNSLELFEQFVKGSDKDGYTEDDIHIFVSNFLVTNQDISKALIKSSFALKASLFGGNDHVLSRDELKRFIKLLRIGQSASVNLLPHLKQRTRNPSGEQLIWLNNAIEEFGVQVGNALVGNSSFAFTKTNAAILLKELTKLYGWKIEADYISFVLIAKQILVGGGSDRIEGEIWPKIFHIVGSLGGGAVASVTANKENMHGSNEYGNFMFNLGAKAMKILMSGVDANGGVITFSKLDNLIDALPKAWLIRNEAEQTYYDPEGFKQFLRPIIKKMLWSQSMTGLDKPALNKVFELASQWNRGQTHLEKIYNIYDIDKNGMSRADFSAASLAYSKPLDPLGKEDVARLNSIANRYVPLFEGKDTEMSFTPRIRHSLGNMSKLHWMNLTAKHILLSYATAARKTKLSTDDALKILDDIGPPMIKLKWIDPTSKDLHIKRLREIDMFMLASNGDTYGDEEELTYYLAVVLSASNLSERIRRDLEDACRLSPGKKDVLEWWWMDAACWKQQFFGNYTRYWDHFEQFTKFYDTISNDQKLQIQTSMMIAARRYGDLDKYPFGGLDNVSAATTIHYIEMMFMRYDYDNDQALDVKETLDAYWNFKQVILRLNKKIPDDDNMLKAGFTFMVKFGEMPNLNPTNAKEYLTLAKFGWWYLWPNQWYINATRVNVYNVLPVIAGSDTPPP